jgi:PhnB protein
MMGAILNPYLGFRGNAREAIEFYSSVFGGELTISTFGEMHASEVPEEQEWIMHSQLTTPSGFTIMASDTPSRMEFTPGTNISVSLSGGPETDAELRGYWDGLADGGTITQPLVTAPWGDSFGMLVDKVGTTWLVNIAGAPQG